MSHGEAERYEGDAIGGSRAVKVLAVEGMERAGKRKSGRAWTSASIEISDSDDSGLWASATRARAQMNSARPRDDLSRAVKLMICTRSALKCSPFVNLSLYYREGFTHSLDSSCREL